MRGVMMQQEGFTLVARCGAEVGITRAAASLSDVLAHTDDAKMSVDVELVALQHLVEVAERIASRFVPRGQPEAGDEPLRILSALSQPHLLAVLRAAQRLQFRAVARLATLPLTSILKGRSADVLRVVLNAPDDLAPDAKRAATEEPLLTPPTSSDQHDVPGSSQGGGDDDDDAMAQCLNDLDARSLRTLKAVSSAWQRRARYVLGDPQSAWRQAPEWSAGAWAVTWFGERLSSDDSMMRKRALLAIDALEPAVELPHFVPLLLAILTPEERSSNRALALRGLSRLEPLTLASHAEEALAALAHLEPHEAATHAALTLRSRLLPTAEADAKEGCGAPSAPETENACRNGVASTTTKRARDGEGRGEDASALARARVVS